MNQKKIFRISLTGSIISEWDLRFNKGDGLTIVNDEIYVVNNFDGKLYVFQNPH